MDLIYRLSGREAKDLNKQLVETQNTLNSKIVELEAKESLEKKYIERIELLEKSVKHHINQLADSNDQVKNLKLKLETEKAIKEKAMKEVTVANQRIDTIQKELFDFQQQLATKNADLNSMVETVSKFEQQVKQLQMPKVPQTQLGKKLHSIKSKK